MTHAPAYLRVAPNRALMQRSDAASFRCSDKILDALAAAGIYARPTLAEVEAERVRRGPRKGRTVAEEPALREVLPMLDGVGPNRADAGVSPPRIVEEARANRARIAEALGDLDGNLRALDRLRREILSGVVGWEEAA